MPDTNSIPQYLASILVFLTVLGFGIQSLIKTWKSNSAESSLLKLMHEEIERMSSQNIVLSSEIGKLQSELVKLSHQLSTLTQENKKLQVEVSDLNAEIIRLHKTITDKEDR